MGKRARPCIEPDILQELTTHRTTKSAIAHVFEVLHERGLLDAQVSREDIKRDVASHADVETPYGKVVQPFDVCTGRTIECCSPSALLYYLCSISAGFADCCKRAVDAAGPEPAMLR